MSGSSDAVAATRTALVVGGTSGIGHGIALALAKRGNVAVTIAGRSQERGDEIIQQLNQANPQQTHRFQQVDAFDLKSVKALADIKPDYLIMTQGMATIQGYTPTINGLDQKLQLHYFSRIYLSKLLAPSMNENPDSRVLTVLSAGVHNKYKNFKEDFELKDSYSVSNAADAAGFYQDAGFEALSEEYPNIVMAHAAPGIVNTNWGTEFPWYIRSAVRCMQPLLGRSKERCGELLVNGWLNLPPPDESSDHFFLLDANGQVIRDGMKHTPEERDIVWEKTLEVLPND